MSYIDNLREFTLRLSQVPGLGPISYRNLIVQYEDIENLYQLYCNRQLDTKLMRKIDIVQVESILGQLSKHSISWLAVWEENYPSLLSHTPDAPIILFYKGQIETINCKNMISVVGSRKLTNEATKWTRDIVSGLASKGWGIVSGMAIGVDALSHEMAIEEGGFTVAVLPSPIDNPLPVTNEYLFRRIIDSGGCVVSEYAPGTNLNKGMFAARNRIVAGLSRGTLVTLAGEESGSLITASCALDYGREVFAFPGNINQPFMTGCNNLIKNDKAKLVTGLKDVLIEFDQWHDEGLKHSDAQMLANTLDLEPELKQMYDQLVNEPLSADELVPKVDRSIMDVISLLMRLQLKGLVKSSDNDKFVAVI